MSGRWLRMWQDAVGWWMTVDVTIQWNVNFTRRERKLSWCFDLPRWLWRPYCWAVGNHWRRKRAARVENYGACVYCDAVPKRWAEWSEYTRMKLARQARADATSGRQGGPDA